MIVAAKRMAWNLMYFLQKTKTKSVERRTTNTYELAIEIFVFFGVFFFKTFLEQDHGPKENRNLTELVSSVKHKEVQVEFCLTPTHTEEYQGHIILTVVDCGANKNHGH
jgi:hypothetical protein